MTSQRLLTSLHVQLSSATQQPPVQECARSPKAGDLASRLVARGAPLPAVQHLLGHADITMTMRYAHLAPDQVGDVVRLLEPGWSATVMATRGQPSAVPALPSASR